MLLLENLIVRFDEIEELEMVIWVPDKQNELRHLYDLAVAMGAPRFLSPDDLQRWFRQNVDNVKAYCVNKYHALFQYPADDSLIGHLIAFLREIHSHGNELADELKRLTVKALHTPLLLNPRSLHPIDSVA